MNRISIALMISEILLSSCNSSSSKYIAFVANRNEFHLVDSASTESGKFLIAIGINGKIDSVCTPKSIDYHACHCEGVRFGVAGNAFVYLVKNGIAMDSIRLSESRISLSTREQKPQMDSMQSLDGANSRNLIEFADYNGDGKKNEFSLQIGSGSCGHTQWVGIEVDDELKSIKLIKNSLDGKIIITDGRKPWDMIASNDSVISTIARCGDNSSEFETNSYLARINKKFESFDYNISCGGKIHDSDRVTFPNQASLFNALFESTNNKSLTYCALDEFTQNYTNQQFLKFVSKNDLGAPIAKSVIACFANNPKHASQWNSIQPKGEKPTEPSMAQSAQMPSQKCKPALTMKSYKSIKIGMSLKQAEAIMGCESIPLNEMAEFANYYWGDFSPETGLLNVTVDKALIIVGKSQNALK